MSSLTLVSLLRFILGKDCNGSCLPEGLILLIMTLSINQSYFFFLAAGVGLFCTVWNWMCHQKWCLGLLEPDECLLSPQVNGGLLCHSVSMDKIYTLRSMGLEGMPIATEEIACDHLESVCSCLAWELSSLLSKSFSHSWLDPPWDAIFFLKDCRILSWSRLKRETFLPSSLK